MRKDISLNRDKRKGIFCGYRWDMIDNWFCVLRFSKFHKKNTKKIHSLKNLKFRKYQFLIIERTILEALK
jgi:hypothetical protein